MPILYTRDYKAAFLKILDSGVEGIENEKFLKQVRLINKLSLSIFFLIIGIGAIFYFLSHRLSILIPAIIEAGLAICPLLFNRKKMYFAASLTTFLIQCAATLYFGMLLQNVLELQTVIFFLLLISFILFDQPKIRKICCIVALLILVTLEANSYITIITPIRLEVPYSIIFKTLSFGGLFFLIVVVGYPYVISHDVNYRLRVSLKNEEKNNTDKSLFIRHISHEIQSNFSGIIKLANSVRKNVPQGESMQELAADLTDACQSYKQMLSNLLEFAKIDAGVFEDVNYEPVNIRSLINQIIRLSERAAFEDKEVKIALTTSMEIPEIIFADQLLLIQVCNNLITNAIKFTNRNTTIDIIVTKYSTSWKIYVKDKGDGISKEKLSEIFNPYVTERNAHNPEGIGLGLYITKHIVKDLLGGSISAYNNAHSGATFEVTLPLLYTEENKLRKDSFG